MSPRAVEQEVPCYPSRPMLRGRAEEEDEEEEEEEEEGKEEEEQGEKRFTGSHQSCFQLICPFCQVFQLRLTREDETSKLIGDH